MQQLPSLNRKKQKISFLEIIFNYILPFINKSYSPQRNIKDDPIADNLSELEKVIFSSLKISETKEALKIRRKVDEETIETTDIAELLSQNHTGSTSDYSLDIEKEKLSDDKPYLLAVTYEDNASEEKLTIKITPKRYSDNKITKNINMPKKDSSISIVRKKQEKSSYTLKIQYIEDYSKENIIISYKNLRHEQMHDFSDRVPGKSVQVFPRSIMGGVLGFTYLGENFMGLREDQIGSKMVNIHECIHTPDEYETRILTEWIMQKERQRYFK